MNYTADTWFFIQLVENKNTKAAQIWKEITKGKGRLVVPTIVICELTRKFLRNNLSKQLNELLSWLEKSEKIFLVGLSPKIALSAGKLGSTFDMHTVDSVILATAIETEFTNLLSGDEHFKPAAKQGKIKIEDFE